MSVPRTRKHARASATSDMASVRHHHNGDKAPNVSPIEKRYPPRPQPMPADLLRDAATYLRRTGNDDLIDMLGLGEVA